MIPYGVNISTKCFQIELTVTRIVKLCTKKCILVEGNPRLTNWEIYKLPDIIKDFNLQILKEMIFENFNETNSGKKKLFNPP